MYELTSKSQSLEKAEEEVSLASESPSGPSLRVAGLDGQLVASAELSPLVSFAPSRPVSVVSGADTFFSRSVSFDTATRRLGGYAAVYNSWSDYMGFYEVFAPGAFAGVDKNSDIRCLLNHDPNLVLGRTKSGTLNVAIDSNGVRYSVDLPNNYIGDYVFDAVQRGDITHSSIAFTVIDDEWQELPEGVLLRTIKKVGAVYDVSPVTYPAYRATSVSKRDLFNGDLSFIAKQKAKKKSNNAINLRWRLLLTKITK